MDTTHDCSVGGSTSYRVAAYSTVRMLYSHEAGEPMYMPAITNGSPRCITQAVRTMQMSYVLFSRLVPTLTRWTVRIRGHCMLMLTTDH